MKKTAQEDEEIDALIASIENRARSCQKKSPRQACRSSQPARLVMKLAEQLMPTQPPAPERS